VQSGHRVASKSLARDCTRLVEATRGRATHRPAGLRELGAAQAAEANLPAPDFQEVKSANLAVGHYRYLAACWRQYVARLFSCMAMKSLPSRCCPSARVSIWTARAMHSSNDVGHVARIGSVSSISTTLASSVVAKGAASPAQAHQHVSSN